MNNVYQRKVLSHKDLREIRLMLEDVKWVSGSSTSTNVSKINSQVVQSGSAYHYIDNLVADRIMGDLEYERMTIPLSLSLSRISKMDVGGQYPIHVDEDTLGDYSTTVFLSDPDSYEGGELVLKLDNGFTEFKLPAGHAVSYKTGIPHYVKEVTSGTRLVTVSWTCSRIPSPVERGIVTKLQQAFVQLPEFENIDPETDCNAPTFLIAECIETLLRIHATRVNK